jgi:hypothetical protein
MVLAESGRSRFRSSVRPSVRPFASPFGGSGGGQRGEPAVRSIRRGWAARASARVPESFGRTRAPAGPPAFGDDGDAIIRESPGAWGRAPRLVGGRGRPGAARAIARLKERPTRTSGCRARSSPDSPLCVFSVCVLSYVGARGLVGRPVGRPSVRPCVRRSPARGRS